MDIDVRHMKEAPSTLLRYISEKGQYTSKGVLPKFKLELTLVDLILTPSSPLNMSCLSSNLMLNWRQTPGVLQKRPAPGASGGGRLRHRVPRAKGSGPFRQCAPGPARGEPLCPGAGAGSKWPHSDETKQGSGGSSPKRI